MSVRIPAFRFLLFLIAFFASTHVFALEVSPDSVEIYTGKTAKLTVSKSSGTVTTVSSNTTVASASYASGNANVTGISAGKTIITARDNNTSKTVEVTVKSALLNVSPNSVAMDIGKTSTITVSNASGTVTVVSSKASVASASYADSKVTVNGLAPGSATLMIKDSNATVTVPVSVTGSAAPLAATDNYTLLAWNDLGMHCMDGWDYAVFAILPPYNTLHAQLKDKSGKLINSNVTLTYEAVEDSNHSINTYSYDQFRLRKTNFWKKVGPLLGLNALDVPKENIGLNLDGLATGNPEPGNMAPSLTPAPMSYNVAYGWFEAEGLPITPKDDNGNKNFYPTVKVVAKDLSGNILATTTTVLPVSDEMTCNGCHASTNSTNPAKIAAKPKAGWVFDTIPVRDWKKNILRLHDEKQASNILYQKALALAGYKSNGLLATANSGKPVLCVACHASNAYFDKTNKKTVMGGITVDVNGTPTAISSFTSALHLKHAEVKYPLTKTPLDGIGDRTACYQCHPGSKTQCLRGAMGKAVDANGDSLMSCQSCHGNMAAVGNKARQGWYNEPTCESCHNSEAPNKRDTSGVDANGIVKVPKTDHTFATNADTPVPGLNLYRFSKGHGGLQCEACHGATHAEYPSSHAEENIQSENIQGHAGPVAECTACHTKVPATVNGGPHGMHTTGNVWVKSHQEANKRGSATTPSCAYCHGTTSAGTPLSAIKVAKTINAGDFGVKNWPAGYQVSCFSCHNGPNPD